MIKIQDDPLLSADIITAHKMIQLQEEGEATNHFSGRLYRAANICHYHVELNSISAQILSGKEVIPFIGNAGGKQKGMFIYFINK